MKLNKFTLKSQKAFENTQTLAAEMLSRVLPEKVTVDFDGKNVVF